MKQGESQQGRLGDDIKLTIFPLREFGDLPRQEPGDEDRGLGKERASVGLVKREDTTGTTLRGGDREG